MRQSSMCGTRSWISGLKQCLLHFVLRVKAHVRVLFVPLSGPGPTMTFARIAKALFHHEKVKAITDLLIIPFILSDVLLVICKNLVNLFYSSLK